jgi:APA family basic amino acid/polyamine antiporter
MSSEPLADEIDVEDDSTPTMPAEFGLATATFVVVASMVGVGVLTTSGFTIYFVGSNELMIFLWLLGALVALCGALSVAELAAALPKTGGDYIFWHEAYGPLAAFLTGWVSFLIGFAGPIALLADASATYLIAPLQLQDFDKTTALLSQRALATLMIVALAAAHASGRHWSAQVQGWTTALKVVVLAVFAIAVIYVGWPHRGNLHDRPPMSLPLARSMLLSLVYIFYAYIGWNASAYMAGEIRNPQRNLPRAILLGTGIVALLYFLLNVAYALAFTAPQIQAMVGDPPQFETVKPIARLAAERFWGRDVADPFSVAIGFILISSLSAYILTGPRIICAMAQARQFPAIAGRLSSVTGTPTIATCLQVGWAIILLWSGEFENVLTYTGVGLAIFSMLTVAAVYVLRQKRPDLPRPFKTPGYPFVPAFFLVVTFALVLAVSSDRPKETGLSLVTILAGVPIYYGWKYFTRRTDLAGDEAVPNA